MLSLLVLALLIFAPGANAVIISFSAPLGFVNANPFTTGGLYRDVPIGTVFTGEFNGEDPNDFTTDTFDGFITYGMDPANRTDFSCCITPDGADGLDVLNDFPLTAQQAAGLNAILSQTRYRAGDVVDLIEISGDNSTSGGGRIEVGLSYLFDSDTFDDDSTDNYPFNQSDVIMSSFFILEENNDDNRLYTAYGLIHVVPLPAAFWLLMSGVLGIVAVTRRFSR